MGEKVKYICLRCGNIYESRAKVPQCPVCKSKRKMKFEEFLALPKEEQEIILGKSISGDSGESPGETTVYNNEKPGETTGETVKGGDFMGEMVKIEEDSLSETVKNRVEERVKKSDRVKGERVKSDSGEIPIPKPKIGLKGVAIISGLVFVYFLYKMGFFDSMIEHLKRLKAFKDLEEENEEVEEVSFENPVLERAKRNLAG